MSTSEIELKRGMQQRLLSLDTPPEIIIGIGNCGRADDGLGWAFLDRIGNSGLTSRIEYRYQLNIEDAELISGYRTVLFVDASISPEVNDYCLSEVVPRAANSFTSHALEPEVVLHLSQSLYGRSPAVLLLEIKGAEWGLREGLSGEAKLHLDRALNAFHALASEFN